MVGTFQNVVWMVDVVKKKNEKKKKKSLIDEETKWNSFAGLPKQDSKAIMMKKRPKFNARKMRIFFCVFSHE